MSNVFTYIVFIFFGILIGVISCFCLFEKITPDTPKRKKYLVTVTFKHTYEIWAFNKDSAIKEALRMAKKFDDVYWESGVTEND